MQLSKYKITSGSTEGFLLVVYQDNHFKSVLNEFKTTLTDAQVNFILKHITDDPQLLKGTIEHHSKNKLKVEPMQFDVDDNQEEPIDYPVKDKIATWCVLFEKYLGIKYKTEPAEAGKLKALKVNQVDFPILVEGYMKSQEWYLKPKSISNFIKKYNEIRVLVFAKPAPTVFPLPYDEVYCNKLDHNDKLAYWKYLRENGYEFVDNGRVRKWIKKEFIGTV